jgi:hypothetical protein
MRIVKEIDPLNEFQVILRNMELDELEGDLHFDFRKIPKKFYKKSENDIFGWRKRRKIINYLFENGCSLTGSRLLALSSIKGIELGNYNALNRNTNVSDWDFVTTEDNIYKLSSELEFRPDNKNGIDLMTCRIINPDQYGYGDSYIDIILVKKMPQTFEIGGAIYSSPLYCLEELYKLSKKNSRFSEKYKVKINELFWRLNHEYGQ